MYLLQFHPDNTLPIQWINTRDRNTNEPLYTTIYPLCKQDVVDYCTYHSYSLIYIFQNINEHALATYHLGYNKEYHHNSQNPVIQWRGGFAHGDRMVVGCYTPPSQAYTYNSYDWSPEIIAPIDITWFLIRYHKVPSSL